MNCLWEYFLKGILTEQSLPEIGDEADELPDIWIILQQIVELSLRLLHELLRCHLFFRVEVDFINVFEKVKKLQLLVFFFIENLF